MAERSKALVKGTSLFGGVGLNPTTARIFKKKILLSRRLCPIHLLDQIFMVGSVV